MAGPRSKTNREFKKKLRKLPSTPGYVSRKDDHFIDRDEQRTQQPPLRPRRYC
jgi:hypothetical protein